MQGKKVKKIIHAFWNWLSRNWLKCLVVVLGSGFTYAYIITHYQLEAPDKYTMIVDLILIILAFMAVAGIIVFLLIRRGVEDGAREISNETQTFTRMEVLASMGYMWWQLHQLSLQGKGEQANKSKSDNPQDYLELAINWTHHAASSVPKLPVSKYEESICSLKNNLAYYLAEKRRLGEN